MRSPAAPPRHPPAHPAHPAHPARPARPARGSSPHEPLQPRPPHDMHMYPADRDLTRKFSAPRNIGGTPVHRSFREAQNFRDLPAAPLTTGRSPITALTRHPGIPPPRGQGRPRPPATASPSPAGRRRPARLTRQRPRTHRKRTLFWNAHLGGAAIYDDGRPVRRASQNPPHASDVIVSAAAGPKARRPGVFTRSRRLASQAARGYRE